MIDRTAFRHVDALQLARALALKTGPRPRPRRVTAFCVWHSEKNPSMDLASKDHGVAAVCRSCGESGDHFAVAAAVWGLDPRRDFRAIALRLADALGLSDIDAPSSDRPPTRRRTEDPIVALAQRIDEAADLWLAGRSARDADLRFIEAASGDDRAEALAILAATDRPAAPHRRSPSAERADRFEEMADHFDQWGWTHSTTAAGVETDWDGIEREMRAEQ